jgi:type IV pilus assembly protein PilA
MTAKKSVEENAAVGNALDSGWVAPTATSNVTSVALDGTNGKITITYTAKVESGKTLILEPTSAGAALASGTVPTGGSIEWKCGGATGGGTLAAKYRPATCR